MHACYSQRMLSVCFWFCQCHRQEQSADLSLCLHFLMNWVYRMHVVFFTVMKVAAIAFPTPWFIALGELSLLFLQISLLQKSRLHQMSLKATVPGVGFFLASQFSCPWRALNHSFTARIWSFCGRKHKYRKVKQAFIFGKLVTAR